MRVWLLAPHRALLWCAGYVVIILPGRTVEAKIIPHNPEFAAMLISTLVLPDLINRQ
jgi:hypothetical protein